MRKLQGVLPPVPTPFEKGEVSPQRLRDNLQKLNATGLSGFLILGSNGEAVLLNEDEKLKVVEAAREAIPRERIMMVGAGCESTAGTVRRVNRFAELGADCALIITPSFYASAMTPESLQAHYLKVAEDSRIPILIYIVPQFTAGIVVDSDTVARLAEHANVVGLKDSSGHMGRFAEYVHKVPTDFATLAGDACTFYAALSLGAAGGILAVANVLPEACVRLMGLYKDGEFAQARMIQTRIIPFTKMVTQRYGVAGLKAAMDLIGYYGGAPRPPLLPVGAEVKEELEAQLQELKKIGLQ